MNISDVLSLLNIHEKRAFSLERQGGGEDGDRGALAVPVSLTVERGTGKIGVMTAETPVVIVPVYPMHDWTLMIAGYRYGILDFPGLDCCIFIGGYRGSIPLSAPMVALIAFAIVAFIAFVIIWLFSKIKERPSQADS